MDLKPHLPIVAACGLIVYAAYEVFAVGNLHQAGKSFLIALGLLGVKINKDDPKPVNPPTPVSAPGNANDIKHSE
jgi:hypothetical protein